MPRSDLAKHLECDTSLSRIVIYGHRTALHDAELVEQSIKETFDWIKSVWVDCDTFDMVTINLDASARYMRYEWFVQLILHIVQSVGWDARKTVLVYDGNTYRLNPS